MYDELVKALRETRERVRKYPGVAMYVPPYQLSAAADAIEELFGKVEQLPRWIPVEERLPRGGENVLAYYHNPYNQFIVCATWDSKRQEWIPDLESIDGYYITAWMPLPEPPKDEVSE